MFNRPLVRGFGGSGVFLPNIYHQTCTLLGNDSSQTTWIIFVKQTLYLPKQKKFLVFYLPTSFRSSPKRSPQMIEITEELSHPNPSWIAEDLTQRSEAPGLVRFRVASAGGFQLDCLLFHLFGSYSPKSGHSLELPSRHLENSPLKRPILVVAFKALGKKTN